MLGGVGKEWSSESFLPGQSRVILDLSFPVSLFLVLRITALIQEMVMSLMGPGEPAINPSKQSTDSTHPTSPSLDGALKARGWVRVGLEAVIAVALAGSTFLPSLSRSGCAQGLMNFPIVFFFPLGKFI